MPLPSIRTQAILTQIGQTELAFPSQWVDEVLILSRAQVYTLPFYSAAFMGMVHHQGVIVPLMRVPEELLPEAEGHEFKRSSFRAIRLNHRVGQFAGVGIVVDAIKGTKDLEQLAAESTSIRMFDPAVLKAEGCQPQRWFDRESAI